MKKLSPAQAEVLPRVTDDSMTAERCTENPSSGLVRTEGSLGRALASIEQRIEVPGDAEDRIVLSLIRRESADTLKTRSLSATELLNAVERRIRVPKQIEDRIVAAVTRGEVPLPSPRRRRRGAAGTRLLVIIAFLLLLGSIALSLLLTARGPW